MQHNDPMTVALKKERMLALKKEKAQEIRLRRKEITARQREKMRLKKDMADIAQQEQAKKAALLEAKHGSNQRRVRARGRGRIVKCPNCGKVHEKEPEIKSNKCPQCRAMLDKKKRKTDLVWRFKHHIATRVSKQYPPEMLEGLNIKLEGWLGYTIPALLVELDRKVRRDYGISLRQSIEEGYHMDHIRPLKSFPTYKPGDVEFRKCWDINNLEMIPAEENLRKGSRWEGDEDSDV